MKTTTHATMAMLSIAGAATHAAERDLQFINIIASTDIIMMLNTGDEPLSLDGWRICTQNSTSGLVVSSPDALDGIVLAPNGVFIIRYANDALPGFPSHHNASDIGPLAPFEVDAYAMSFYFPDDQGAVDFDNPAQMGDHIQWKRSFISDDFTAQCAQTAQDAGLWADANEWIHVRVLTYLIENQDRDHGQMHSPDDYNVIFECRADLSDDGQLDFFDVSAFLNAYMDMDPAADFSRDGNLTFFDVSLFLQSFSVGQCPSF